MVVLVFASTSFGVVPTFVAVSAFASDTAKATTAASNGTASVSVSTVHTPAHAEVGNRSGSGNGTGETTSDLSNPDVESLAPAHPPAIDTTFYRSPL